MTPNMGACGSLLQGTSETEEEESQEEQLEDQEGFEEKMWKNEELRSDDGKVKRRTRQEWT